MARRIGLAVSNHPRSQELGAAAAAALLAGVLLLSGCAGEPETQASRPHVVIVLIDELRKDTADALMTRLNALAERGIRFANMRSAAPWTYPSVISLMTGLYPQQHGADGDLDRNRLSVFDADLPLLPKLLQEAGYHTAAFVTNPFLQTFNPFHRSFDHYDISFVKDLGNLRVGGELWGTPRMFADDVEAALVAYFDARSVAGPEFTYVHYIDVHGPWDDAPFPPDYDSAVRFVDEHVTRLYDYFMRRYQGRLLFLVTSDHGRAMPRDLDVQERPGRRPVRVNKMSMHDFNLRIPLLVLPGAHGLGPRLVTQPCSNVDVVPTLLEWLELRPSVALAGVSLLPAIRGEALDLGDRPIYAKNDAFGLWTDAMVWRGLKYMRYFKSNGEVGRRRIFDPGSDPMEVDNLAGDWHDAGPVLADLAGTHGVEYQARFTETDPELVRQLRALGYLR
jgi:arylsulfatase A-like enzyme